MTPFGLYVHVPYCRTLCPYCDFNVVAGSDWPEEEYVDGLVAELGAAAASPPWPDRIVETIYLGGGTPSLFSPLSVGRILDGVRERFAVADDVETTLEAMPDAMDPGSLAGFREAGVNRLSIGIESFDPELLRTIGRRRTAEHVTAAVPQAREAGFRRVSVDLLFGIPGGTLEGWKVDLDRAIEQAPEHVSAYALTWEPGTAFHRRRERGSLRPVGEELETEMFLETRRRLGDTGYEAYEVSNFAKPGFESRHNHAYWTGTTYLGVGAGAHSHLPSPEGAVRWSNERDTRRWLAGVAATGRAIAFREELSLRQAAGEVVFLGLRTREGVDAKRFRDRFGREVTAIFPEIRDLGREGLVSGDDSAWRLTPRGLLFADAIAERFVEPAA